MLFLIVSAILLGSLILIYFKIADRFNIIDKPNQRSSHTRITIRGGGIVFYFGAFVYSLWFGGAYPWFTAGLTLITLISLTDDIRPVPNRIRIVFHFTAMLLLFAEWGLFTGMPWWYMAFALVFCTGLINAWNFMDGINGITGGYSLVVLLTLAAINTNDVSFIDQPFIAAVILSLLVFNFFNFRKKARCFAGDVGSVSIAFIILFVLGSLVIQTRDLSYIVLLAVYGTDSVLTIVHRLMLHENIFEAHRKHAYQIMANELKVPHLRVTGLYMGIQALINAGFLFVSPTWRFPYLVLILVVLSLTYMLFMKKYFVLHRQLG